MMSKKVDNQKNQRIQVFARCRPLNIIERKQCSPSVVEVIPEKKEIVLKDRNTNREFFFDKVFPPDTKQIAVYKAVVGPLIQEVLMGYNCTVFAYGQTGTGKTYTMEGERNNSNCSWEDDPAAGIIPRSLHQLFEELNKEENVEFSVRVSFLELYNEELFDLLSSTELSKLRLYEDTNRKGSVIIHGLEEILVNNKDEVYTILEKGTARRQTAATMLNATSSRSHTVFSVTVHIKENTVEGEELLKTGKFNLVDLAGSENVGRSGAIDKRAREAGNINQSLLTLGRVITALIEKQPHIPYRESKLTRLLQDSLGGHTKTSIIATISPALCNFDETISTLDYATKAKSITIKPEVNQKMTKRALIREYTEEIERLRKDLAAARNNQGFFIDVDNYTSLVNKSSEQCNQNKELTEKIEALTAEIAKVEQLFTSTKEELGKTREEYYQTTQKYEATKGALNYTQKILSKTTLERDEKQYVINIQKGTEKKLSHQAQTLLQVAAQTTDDVDKLRAKIGRKQNVEKTNEELSKEFRIMSQKQFAEFHDMITEENKSAMQDLQSVNGTLSKLDCGLLEHQQTMTDLHSKLDSYIESSLKEFSAHLQMEATNGRQWINDLSGNMHSQRDKLVLEQQAFLAETLPTLLKKLYAKSTEWEDWILNMHKEIEQKTNHLRSVLEDQTAKQENLLKTLKSSLDSFFSEFDATMASLKRKNQSRIESEDKLSQAIKVLTDMKAEENKHRLWEEDIYSRFDNSKLEVKSLEKPLNTLETEIKTTEDTVSELSGISAIIKLDEASTIKESCLKSNETISLKVAEFLEHSKMKQIQIFEELKISLEDHDTLLESIQNDDSKIKTIITSASDKINNNIRCLNECTEPLKSTISYSRNKVTEAEKRNSLAESRLKEEIRKLDLTNEKFILEDLVKDIPTGTTPQRKTYVYPKALAATSPHDRILQRYRSQLAVDTEVAINLPLDTSFNESEEFKSTSTEDISSAVVSHNTSFASDDYDSGGETDSSAVSDISAKGSRNKENRKKGKSSSRLPKRLPKFTEFVKPAPISGRKPLVSNNPDKKSPS